MIILQKHILWFSYDHLTIILSSYNQLTINYFFILQAYYNCVRLIFFQYKLYIKLTLIFLQSSYNYLTIIFLQSSFHNLTIILNSYYSQLTIILQSPMTYDHDHQLAIFLYTFKNNFMFLQRKSTKTIS